MVRLRSTYIKEFGQSEEQGYNTSETWVNLAKAPSF